MHHAKKKNNNNKKTHEQISQTNINYKSTNRYLQSTPICQDKTSSNMHNHIYICKI